MVTYRSVKGSNLTAAEVDGNFAELAAAIQDLIDNPVAGVSISNITQSGQSLTIHMSDASTFGPFTMPKSFFAWKGDWEPETDYWTNDVVRVSGVGVFLVLRNHESLATFSDSDGDSSGDYYAKMNNDPAGLPYTYTRTNTSWFLYASDAEAFFRFTNAAGVVITLQDNADEAIATDTEFRFRVGPGGGGISFTYSSNVTLNGVDGFDPTCTTVGGMLFLKKVGTNEWDLWGDLDPA